MEWMRGAFNRVVKKPSNDVPIDVQDKTYADVKWQTLPTKKLSKPTSNEERCCVIYFNGTFSPCHIGHLKTMQAAGKHLKEQGVKKLL